jgi:hypothetical protein
MTVWMGGSCDYCAFLAAEASGIIMIWGGSDSLLACAALRVLF